MDKNILPSHWSICFDLLIYKVFFLLIGKVFLFRCFFVLKIRPQISSIKFELSDFFAECCAIIAIFCRAF